MQFDLLSRPPARRDSERAGSPSTLPGAWRDSAISQLDAIAAANDRRAATRLRSQAAAFALLGLLALALSAWWVRPQERASVARTGAPVTPAVRGAVVPAPQTPTPAAPPVDTAAAVLAPAPVVAAAPARRAAAAPPGPASAAHAAEPKARALALPAERRPRDAAAARAPVAPVQQATGAQVQTPAAAPVRPAEVTAPDAPPSPRSAAAPADAAPRADVRSLCAGQAFLAASFCQARECRKAEHLSDPACVRLREIEQARERASRDR